MRPLPDLDTAPVVIRQARSKALWLLAGCSAFVLVGGWIARHPDGRWVGGLNVAFFGLGALVALAGVLRPGTLTLAPQGLTQRVLWRRHDWRWNEVSNFRVWRLRRTRLVTFDSTKARSGMLRRANALLGAGSASLAPQWSLSPEALVELLEAARRRWSALDSDEARTAPPA